MAKRNRRNRNRKPKAEGVDQVLGDVTVYDASKGEAVSAKEANKKIITYVDDVAVEIEEEVYHKIMHWIDKADGEVSGLGKITMENGIFRVTSAILLKQENTSVTTDIDAAAVGKAMFELKDEPGHMNWWWHSHVNMEVFWSGTDMDTIHEFGNQGWVLATVLNKKRETRSCYFQKGTGFIPSILIDDIPTRTIFMASEETFEQWDKEFTEKVDEKKLKPGWIWKKTPPSVGSYTPKESWEGAEEYHDGFPRLPGNGNHARFNDSDERDSLPGEDESEMSTGNWYTDEEINDMVLEQLEAMGVEMPEKGAGRKKKRVRQ